MENVITFPGTKHMAERFDAQRADDLRKAIRANPKIGAARIETAAKNLFRTLTEAERARPGFKREFCQLALGAKPADSTKRLHEVALDPAKPEKDAKKQPLRKKADIYLELANTLAKMTGRDPDATLLALFEGAAVQTDARAISPDEDIQAEFWRTWSHCTEEIIRDLGPELQRAFRLDAKFGGNAKEMAPPTDFAWDRAEHFDDMHWSAVLRYLPRIPIGTIPCSPIICRDRRQGADGEMASWSRIWLRLWWGIAPIGPDAAPRGCFMITLATEQSADVLLYADLREAEDNEPVSEFDTWEEMFGVQFWRDPISAHRTDQLDVQETRIHEACLDLSWNQFALLDDGSAAVGTSFFSTKPDRRTEIILAEFFPQYEWDSWSGGSTPIRFLEPQGNWRRMLNLADFDPEVTVDWAASRPRNHDVFENGAIVDQWGFGWQAPKRSEPSADRSYPFSGNWEQAASIWPQSPLSNTVLTAFPNLTRHCFFETIGRSLERRVIDTPKGKRPWNMLRDKVTTYIEEVDAFAAERLSDWRKATEAE